MTTFLYTALPVKEFLAKKIHRGPTQSCNALLAHQISLRDFFLFPSMKNHRRGPHFKTVEEGQKDTPTILNNLKENDFSKCFNSQKQRRNSCTATEETTKKTIWVQCCL
jgi:hypothetical protein